MIASEDSAQQPSEGEASQQQPSNQVEDEVETVQISEEQVDKEDYQPPANVQIESDGEEASDNVD